MEMCVILLSDPVHEWDMFHFV